MYAVVEISQGKTSLPNLIIAYAGWLYGNDCRLKRVCAMLEIAAFQSDDYTVRDQRCFMPN